MRMIKVTDYIVEFLIEKGCKHTFGYPGGSAANLVDSFYKYRNRISAHVAYHEQGAAFEACGYAQATGKIGVAYSTGGPGATNLLTGIGHAFFDSIPLLCLTGNVNTNESARGMRVRQRAFQECEIIPVVKPLTKYCAYVDKPEDIRFHLEKAYSFATSGRKGPVLLDLPMDITRAVVDADSIMEYSDKCEVASNSHKKDDFANIAFGLLKEAKRPCLVLGNGVEYGSAQLDLQEAVDNLGIPFVTSMTAFDLLPGNRMNYGFLGASGSRSANIITAKSDLIISIGSRLDIRQVGVDREGFAAGAKIIRVDIDEGELEYKLHKDEIGICMTAKEALSILKAIPLDSDYSQWCEVCARIRDKTKGMDIRTPNVYMKKLSEMIAPYTTVTTDVGQNQIWTAQSFELKEGQKVLFSGGFGAMGHALPAAIGAYYGNRKPVIAIAGDGGMQMNIQELQFIAREQIPIKVIVFNNHALGMIRHFQEVWFDRVFFQTKPEGGFTSPVFSRIADAYGIDSILINDVSEIDHCKEFLCSDKPALIELNIMEDTYEYPKLRFGSPSHDQEPLLDRNVFNELMNM